MNPKELQNGAWMKKDKVSMRFCGLFVYIEVSFFNQLALLMPSEILKRGIHHRRGQKVISTFMEECGWCYQKHTYSKRCLLQVTTHPLLQDYINMTQCTMCMPITHTHATFTLVVQYYTFNIVHCMCVCVCVCVCVYMYRYSPWRIYTHLYSDQ